MEVPLQYSTDISISRRGSITHSESYAIGLHVSVDCLSNLSQIIVYTCQKLIDLAYAFEVGLMWVWLLKMPTQNTVHIVGGVKVSIEESLGDS